MRYGVAIARGNLYEPGTYTIRRKVEWPHWTPTKSMIERNPEYAEFEDGQEPGPTNPLGSRALYLFVGQRDTYCGFTDHRNRGQLAGGRALDVSEWSWRISTSFIPGSRSVRLHLYSLKTASQRELVPA